MTLLVDTLLVIGAVATMWIFLRYKANPGLQPDQNDQRGRRFYDRQKRDRRPGTETETETETDTDAVGATTHLRN